MRGKKKAILQLLLHSLLHSPRFCQFAAMRVKKKMHLLLHSSRCRLVAAMRVKKKAILQLMLHLLHSSRFHQGAGMTR